MKKKLKPAITLAIILCVSFFLDNFVVEAAGLVQNDILDQVMLWFSHAMTIIGVLLILGSLMLYEEKKTRYIPALFLSFFLAFAASELLKLVFMRHRPLGMEYLSFSIIGWALSLPYYSFPSSHAAVSFSVLPILDKEFRKLNPFWILFAIMVVISRIYLYKHYLSDIVAGVILGYFIGFLMLKAEEKHVLEKKIKELFQ
ncbi:phosphatase PAP2 family protein [Candidatus Woesearchaeota archaeon]|nr:phosphatase PAP2 family protein [Candidatus Woesearchaeota archaeon]